jgi:hypothetical protein
VEIGMGNGKDGGEFEVVFTAPPTCFKCGREMEQVLEIGITPEEALDLMEREIEEGQ